MSESEPISFRPRLNLSDESENDLTSAVSSDCQVDGISSLVALALERDLLLVDNQVYSQVNVRAGRGAFATIRVLHLIDDLPQRWNSPSEPDNLAFFPEWQAGQKLAAKITAVHGGAESLPLWASIAKEIRILSHPPLRKHPNIVDIVGLGWTGSVLDNIENMNRWPVLLMEYADCGTLQDFFELEDVDFTWGQKVEISYDIVQGLEAIHESGVIHGDLKLANILVFRTGAFSFTAKLCDFGSAMIPTDFLQDESVRQTVFTPPWNAPESSQRIPQHDLYKVDIYSFGLLLCRIFLEGRDPFLMKIESEPSLSQISTDSIIETWKKNDYVSNICKFAVRRFDCKSYTSQQLIFLEDIFDMTVRTDLKHRVDKHSQLKNVFRPGAVMVDSKERWLRLYSADPYDG